MAVKEHASLVLSRATVHHQIPVTEVGDPPRFLSFDRANDTLVTGSSSTISLMSQIKETNPMRTTEHPQTSTTDTSSHPVSHRRANRPHHHTHVQQVAGCIHVHVVGGSGC